MSRIRLAVFLGTLGVSVLASAHPGQAPHADLQAGLVHPFAGLDHALAALAVGLWSATQPGVRRLLAPVVFLALMALGFVVGHRFGLPDQVDVALAASVAVMGALIAARRRIPDIAALGVIGAFALLHGVAHGSEAPAASLLILAPFGAGLVGGTMALHLLGLASGEGIRRAASSFRRKAGAPVLPSRSRQTAD